MNENNEAWMREREFGSYRCTILKLLPTIVDPAIRRILGITEFCQIHMRRLNRTGIASSCQFISLRV